jgi:hypothetical protein
LTQYLDIYYEEYDQNWYTNTILNKRYEMGRYNKEYFGNYKESQDIWDSWNQTLIACPIFSGADKLYLADDGLQMVTKNLNIKFDRCKNNSFSQNSKSDSEIDIFFSDLKIYSYSLSESIAFT